MTDITPLTAIDRLHGNGAADHSLFTDISRTLGRMSGKGRSEQWKQNLREDLVREHIAAQQKKVSPIKSSFRKLFRLS